MREVRRALLEADVSLDVVRGFIDRVREQAIGATVVKSVTPGQMVVKIVHDELVATLGADGQTIDLNAVPPVAILTFRRCRSWPARSRRRSPGAHSKPASSAATTWCCSTPPAVPRSTKR